MEVQQLATHLVNPRTLCWKVVVPYKYKQLMEKDELYPPGWTHRKFFGPRKAKENPAKHARMDDQLVTEALKEKERKEAETKLIEEKRLREEGAQLDVEMEEERLREQERIAEQQLEAELAETAANDDSDMQTGESQDC